MSVNRRIAFGAAASWFSRGVTIMLGLVLMPVLFRHLPKEELGVWLLLGQSWAALGILDLGFGVTFTRRIAFAKGKSGGDSNSPLTEESTREIADLVATGRRAYHILALAAFAISFGGGFFYLRGLELHGLPLTAVWLAWSVLCLSQAFSVWATVWTCVLQGVGYIGWDAILASFVNSLTLTAQIIAALCGGGLVSLAIVAACGALVQRFVLLTFARNRRPELFQLHGRWRPELLRDMAPLAIRAWLTALGTVIIHNSDQFFIAGFAGAVKLPSYRAAYLVILNLHMLAGVFGSASSPFVSQLWMNGDRDGVRKIVKRNLRLGLLLVMSGVGCVLALGQSLFDVWLGAGNFIGYPVLLVFSVLFILEQQSFVMSTSCRATEDEAFSGWALAAGALKIVFTFLLLGRFGLVGIALGTLFAQLLTNHWFMVFRTLQRLGMTLADHLLNTILPCVLVMVGSGAAAWGVKQLFAGHAPAGMIVCGGAASGLVLLSGLWLLVFDQAERRRIVARVRLA